MELCVRNKGKVKRKERKVGGKEEFFIYETVTFIGKKDYNCYWGKVNLSWLPVKTPMVLSENSQDVLYFRGWISPGSK